MDKKDVFLVFGKMTTAQSCDLMPHLRYAEKNTLVILN